MPEADSEFSGVSDMIKHHLGRQREQSEKDLEANKQILEEQEKRLRKELARRTKELQNAEQRHKEAAHNRIRATRELENSRRKDKKKVYTYPQRPPPIDKTPIAYRVPSGTTILIYADSKPVGFPQHGEKIQPSDFQAIVSSKEVTYSPSDVIVNPVLGLNSTNREFEGLLQSLYVREETYFVFKLPANDRGIPYILVPKDSVEVEWKDNGDMRRLLKELLNNTKDNIS